MGEVEPTSNNLVLHLDHSDLFQIFMKGAGKGMGLPGMMRILMEEVKILLTIGSENGTAFTKNR